MQTQDDKRLPAAAGPHAAEGRLAPGQGVRVGPSALTRRQFAAAAAATMAAAAAGSAAAEARADADAGEGGADAAGEDEEDEVTNILYAFEDLTESSSYEPQASYTLPLGCNVYADCPTRACVVQSNAGGRPFTLVGCLDFETGAYEVVIPESIAGGSFAASEARCTERLIAWVEVDNATDDWVLYAAPFDGGAVGRDTPGLVELGSGDADWLPPQFAVAGSAVVWQVMPDPSGPHVQESSHAYRWVLGSDSGVEVWESPGRFACAPSISAGVLTIVPRVNADEGVYYGITALDMDAGMEQVGQLVLPVSVRPLFATRIGDDFAFSIEANYGYGGLLGSMGYYIGPDADDLSYIAREPSAHISHVGGCYVVKSQLIYFVVDPVAKAYGSIASADNCVDYGDYPATTGTVDLFVTYAAVKDAATGVPSGVLVRTFSRL